MKKTYLFPNYFKKVGWIITIPSLIILILNIFEIIPINFDYSFYGLSHGVGLFGTPSQWGWYMNETDFTLTILPIIIVVGFVFISFSKEKIEDEMITQIREKSFVWAIIASSIIFVLGTLFLYGIIYLYFLGCFIYLVFLLFILKFHIELSRLQKSMKNEE